MTYKEVLENTSIVQLEFVEESGSHTVTVWFNSVEAALNYCNEHPIKMDGRIVYSLKGSHKIGVNISRAEVLKVYYLLFGHPVKGYNITSGDIETKTYTWSHSSGTITKTSDKETILYTSFDTHPKFGEKCLGLQFGTSGKGRTYVVIDRERFIEYKEQLTDYLENLVTKNY